MNEYCPFGVYNRNRENKMGEVFSGKVVLIIKFGFFGGEVVSVYKPYKRAGRSPRYARVGPPSGLGWSASGCHGPMPRCGGSGRHRAPARPAVRPNAKNKENTKQHHQ